MPAIARPIFQNGQRLTAEQLTQLVEYLRSQLRRVLLGVSGTGVALGLELEPLHPAQAHQLTINPGVALDGTGRLLVVSEQLFFDPDAIARRAGKDKREGDIYRVRLVHEESFPADDPCNPLRPLRVIERTLVEFTPETEDTLRGDRRLVAGERTLDPWALDGHPRADGGVTLGFVRFGGHGAEQLTASHFGREGLAARLATLSDSDGQLAIRFGGPDGLMEFTAPATFDSPVTFAAPVGGAAVQATDLGPPGMSFAAATVRGGAQVDAADGRVLEIGGGAGPTSSRGGRHRSELAAGFAGVCGVPCEVVVNERVPDTIRAAGVPLELALSDHDEPHVRVQRAAKGGPNIVGLSAGPQYPHAHDPERHVVPVATAGLVKVHVHKPARRVVPLGANLVVHDSESLRADEEGVVVARAAQRVESRRAAGIYPLYAWVVAAR